MLNLLAILLFASCVADWEDYLIWFAAKRFVADVKNSSILVCCMKKLAGGMNVELLCTFVSAGQ